MLEFGELKYFDLRQVWKNEATDFAPRLAENVESLGKALGLELEIQEQGSSIGEFSLDVLARDLGSSSTAIIENQVTKTDHDHLGKLITYASGHDTDIIIWLAESMRDEQRQTMGWLNQRTDSDTHFLG